MHRYADLLLLGPRLVHAIVEPVVVENVEEKLPYVLAVAPLQNAGQQQNEQRIAADAPAFVLVKPVVDRQPLHHQEQRAKVSSG